jgi:hypothetical protein
MLVAESLMLAASLFLSSTVPDNSCRDARLKIVAAVVISTLRNSRRTFARRSSSLISVSARGDTPSQGHP